VTRTVGGDELLFYLRREVNAAEHCPSMCVAQLHREAAVLYAVELDRLLTLGCPPPDDWRVAFTRTTSRVVTL